MEVHPRGGDAWRGDLFSPDFKGSGNRSASGGYSRAVGKDYRYGEVLPREDGDGEHGLPEGIYQGDRAEGP